MVNKMKDLKNKLEKLQEKQTWLRKGLKEWLQLWKENTIEIEGEFFYICKYGDYMAVDHYYYIEPGNSSIYGGYCEFVEYEGFDDKLSKDVDDIEISDIKSIIAALPKRVQDFSKRVDHSIIEAEELLAKLIPAK